MSDKLEKKLRNYFTEILLYPSIHLTTTGLFDNTGIVMLRTYIITRKEIFENLHFGVSALMITSNAYSQFRFEGFGIKKGKHKHI